MSNYIPLDGDIKFPEDSGVTSLADARKYTGEFSVWSSSLVRWVSSKEHLIWDIEVK
jgi:hypothetical protein